MRAVSGHLAGWWPHPSRRPDRRCRPLFWLRGGLRLANRGRSRRSRIFRANVEAAFGERGATPALRHFARADFLVGGIAPPRRHRRELSPSRGLARSRSAPPRREGRHLAVFLREALRAKSKRRRRSSATLLVMAHRALIPEPTLLSLRLGLSAATVYQPLLAPAARRRRGKRARSAEPRAMPRARRRRSWLGGSPAPLRRDHAGSRC